MAHADTVSLLSPLRAERNAAGTETTVGLAKVLLPVAAAFLVLLILAWPRFASSPLPVSIKPGALESAGLVMTNPRYAGQDSQHRPFAIGAESARPLGADGMEILLDKPRADLVTEDGAWVVVTADHGRFFPRKKQLVLGATVSLRRESAYEVTTGEMFFDLESGRAVGSGGVSGKGQFGRFEADGIEFLDRGKRIRLIGKSRMKLSESPAAMFAAPQDTEVQ